LVFCSILPQSAKGALRIVPIHDQLPALFLGSALDGAFNALTDQHQAPLQGLLFGARGNDGKRRFHPELIPFFRALSQKSRGQSRLPSASRARAAAEWRRAVLPLPDGAELIGFARPTEN